MHAIIKFWAENCKFTGQFYITKWVWYTIVSFGAPINNKNNLRLRIQSLRRRNERKKRNFFMNDWTCRESIKVGKLPAWNEIDSASRARNSVKMHWLKDRNKLYWETGFPKKNCSDKESNSEIWIIINRKAKFLLYTYISLFSQLLVISCWSEFEARRWK